MTVLWLFQSIAVSKPRSSFARDDRVCRFNAVQVCDGCHNGAWLSQFGTPSPIIDNFETRDERRAVAQNQSLFFRYVLNLWAQEVPGFFVLGVFGVGTAGSEEDFGLAVGGVDGD